MHVAKPTHLTPQAGFTLIELIMVIVLLGVLAATAAPRFINVSSEANTAVLKAMGGAIRSAASMVYAKSLIQGVSGSVLANIDLNGDGSPDIETRYGYPSGSRDIGISKAMEDSLATDWMWSTDYARTKFYLTNASFVHTSGLYINQVPIVATNCYLIYHHAVNAQTPATLEYVTSGC